MTDGILLLLFFVLFITPGKYLGLGGMGVFLFVGFLISIGDEANLSWVSLAYLVGSLVCIGVWVVRKIEAPSSPNDSPNSKDSE